MGTFCVLGRINTTFTLQMKEGKIGIYDIAAICRFHGVEKAILCPGSRCAPLTLAFSRTEGIDCLSIIDERSAAFIALGIAETTHRPVVLVCTSGSAVLNFGPALAEAYYRRIPLIVITADRPQRLVGQHDGQTMNQPNVFANYILESFSLSGDIQTEQELAYLHRTINAAAIKATHTSGPVHINISFEEPLYLLDESGIKARFISYIERADELKAHLAELVKSYSKWMLLIGSRQFDKDENLLIEKLSSVFPVITETISNIHGNSISNGNEIIRASSNHTHTNLSPQVLVTFGDGIVSKNVKNFIRKHKPAQHIHVDLHGDVIDTYQCLTGVMAVDMKTFCQTLLDIMAEKTGNDDYLSTWKNNALQVKETVSAIIPDLDFGDLRAMDFITKHIPNQAIVHVGNSMAVRYLNICAYHLSEATIYCNRGTSGIDGSISTAVGNAIGLGKQVWIISGDLSFQYDGNALWNGFVPNNLRIIIINNSGGGIFRLIDGPSSVPEITERFETRTSSTAEHKAKQFGLAYLRCHDEASLQLVWDDFVKENGVSKILEIYTDPLANENIFKIFQQKLSNTI